MMKETNNGVSRAALPLATLAIPIVFESFFRTLVSSIDAIMLSSYSQESVAGVGLVTQYIFFIQILFNVICIGTSIVLAQYLGARREEDCRAVTQGSIVMISCAGLAIALAVGFGAGPLLSFYRIEEGVRTFAWQYLAIFGGLGSVFVAFNLLQATILRSYGYTKDAMFISIVANVLNVIGNSFSLYGWFGLPVTGVIGVASSSTVSQIVACFLFAWRIKKHPDVFFSARGARSIGKETYRKILSIGIPTAGENLSYNVGQITIMAMVSTLGTWAMSAQVYAQTIVRFVMLIAFSIGNAVQIKMGYLVGSRRLDEAYRKLWGYQLTGTLISFTLVILLNFIKGPIVGIFTHEAEIAAITCSLFVVSIYIETGRSINLITISALKGSGDVKFPVFTGICTTWLFGVGGSWLVGLHLGIGMIGIWLAVGTDETLRGLIMLGRWKSKRWQTKAIG